MNGEREFDGIKVDGMPLADVIKDQRDNRIIQCRNRKRHGLRKFTYAHHQRILPKDRKPSKGRHLSNKELEEVIMNEGIEKINKEGLTMVEAIYLAFKENNWKALRSPEIAFATDVKLPNVSSILSKMTKDGMLVREEKERRKYYYSVSPELEDFGRMAWLKMYREIDNRLKKEKKKPKVAKKSKVEKVVENQPVDDKTLSIAPAGSEESREDVAKGIHESIKYLNLEIANAHVEGLTVEMKQDENGVVKVRVYKEY
jgi:DNA-binding MarR family transcriptional regulator